MFGKSCNISEMTLRGSIRTEICRYYLANFHLFTNGPRNAKTCLQANADSEGPDQPARSLVMVFTIR